MSPRPDERVRYPAVDAAKRPRSRGRAFIWLCGGALALNLLLVAGQLALIGWRGFAYFWPRDLELIETKDGRKLLGEVREREQYRPADLAPDAELPWRLQLEVGNRDIAQADFVWIDERTIVARSRPDDALHVERAEWGDFHGFLVDLRRDDAVIASGSGALPQLEERIAALAKQRGSLLDFERGELGDANYELEKLRLERKQEERPEFAARQQQLDGEFARLAEQAAAKHHELERETARFRTASGEEKTLPIADLFAAIAPNQRGTLSRFGLFVSRLGGFLVDDPRESNTQGGIFPALFGTVLMVFLMSIAVVPLGVVAAVYLREYARQGPLVRLVRIAVNNLAGVPSIVFGVFGLGFFVYGLGGSIDQLFFKEALPQPTFGTGGILWAALTLALLTVPVVIVATEEGLAAVPRAAREGSLALGATKFETLWRVVLPAAGPGLLTGVILATARAAGEVAPLMVVGMVKLAPALPIDHHPPFLHLDRKFMHLGFHLFDVGFQSPNAEATTPLVFATALVLVALVVVMNLTAVTIRNRLRAKYATSAV